LNSKFSKAVDQMSRDERLAELARILARAIARLQQQPKPPDKSAQNSGFEP
jgi:hypothetical protein